MIHIGLNYSENKISFEQASDLTKKYYSEYGYDALENIIYDAFADSGIIEKKAREDGKKIIEERKRLITEQKFLELEQMDKILKEKREALKEEDRGESTLKTSPSGNG